MSAPRDPAEIDPADATGDQNGRAEATDRAEVADGAKVTDRTDAGDPAAVTDRVGVADRVDATDRVEVNPGDSDDGASPRRRHAAEGSSFRLPGWMIALAGLIALGLVAWLVIGLAGGEDDDKPAASSSASSEATSSAPTAVDIASLPQVLCMGSSYAMVDTGLSQDQLLADPAGIEAQFPGSKLSTIPPGCLAGSDARDEAVLALGPFTTVDEACAAGKALPGGAAFTAYAGSADTGLAQTTCP